jgi:hypothetical protein
MPIRVECPRCQDVSHFADNDAGLAVACLACGQHMRVPKGAPKAAPPPPPAARGDELFASYTPPEPAPAAQTPPVAGPAGARRARVRPAGGRSAWRTFGLFVAVLICGGLATLYFDHRRKTAPQVASNETPTTQPTSQPASRPAAVAVAQPRPANTAQTAAAIKPPTPATKVIAAATPPAAAVIPVMLSQSSYTPPAAPVGFVGLERIDLTGHLVVDSYDAAAGPYTPETVRAAARLLSNGPIQLAGDGELRAEIHPGEGSPFKAPKRITVTGATDPLPARLAAPPVRLDPFAHDSTNAALPPEFFKGGNLIVFGNRTVTLPAGVYYLNDLTVDAAATLRLQGPTTLLVSGRVNLVGNVETHANRPAHFRIRVTGDKPVTITHRNTLYLDLYAPQSPIDVSGKGDVFGSIVGRFLRVSGTRPLHFDESLLAR